MGMLIVWNSCKGNRTQSRLGTNRKTASSPEGPADVGEHRLDTMPVNRVRGFFLICAQLSGSRS